MSVEASISFKLTPMDYQALSVFLHGRSSNDSKWTAAAAMMSTSLGGTVVGLLITSSLTVPNFVAVLVATSIFCAVYITWLWPGAERRAKIQSKRYRGNLLGERTIRLDANGVHQEIEFSQGVTRWEGVQRVAVTETHLFIFNGPMSAYIIPRRAFNLEVDFAEFTKVAQRYWAPPTQISHSNAFPVVTKNP
jgi:YcxB-like protein